MSGVQDAPISTESEADPIGDLCPVCGSMLEAVGDLGEIVGYRVIETRGGTSHSGASGAGQRSAERVGEIIARREFKHARVRLEIGRCRRAPTTARRECRPSLKLSGVIAANGAARRKFALRPRRRFGWRAAKWDRPQPRSRRDLREWRPREHHGRRGPGRLGTRRHEPR